MCKHLVIPDCQVTPDSPKDHLHWIGHYIVEKKPDVIVHLGDFADMRSLSYYDKGKLKGEGRRYKADITAATEGMGLMLGPLMDYNNKQRVQKGKLYQPDKYLTLGNHEFRIIRAVEDDPAMEGFMSIDDLQYESYGWKVVPFLEIVTIDGVSYSHYFANPLSSRPYGGQSIDTRLKNINFSFCQGHQQVNMMGSRNLSNGRIIRGLVSGSCYLHDESYRVQSNSEKRQLFLLSEVNDGDYCLAEISLDYLCKKYEGIPLWKFMKKKYPQIFEGSTWLKRQAAKA